jgi:hypothetical protein
MKGLMLSVLVENISTRKDRTVKVILGTQELSQGQAGELFNLMNTLAAVYISPKELIDQKEIDQVDKLDPELQGRTQSQRIRNTLFLLFQQGNEGFQSFDTYYKAKTEMYIEHLKSKIA